MAYVLTCVCVLSYIGIFILAFLRFNIIAAGVVAILTIVVIGAIIWSYYRFSGKKLNQDRGA